MKRIKVRGHYKRILEYYRVVVDPDNPANETKVPVYKIVWIKPYEKLVK